jgi:hypothetical protein
MRMMDEYCNSPHEDYKMKETAGSKSLEIKATCTASSSWTEASLETRRILRVFTRP